MTSTKKPLTSTLPPMTHKFKIQVTGRETGINWVGEFQYKRPTLGERGRVDVMRSRLCGDQEALLPETIEFHEMIAYLRYSLTEYPEWWQESNYGLDLYDGNVVNEVYDKCMEFEAQWKSKVFSGKAEDVGGATGDKARDTTAPQGTNTF